MANGEIIRWSDLRDALISINYACRTNLVISVAACDGAHLVKVATRLDRAPFWALIATEGVVGAGSLYCVGLGKRQRVEELVSQGTKQPAIKDIGVNRIRKHVKQQLSEEEKHFEALKRKFFFLDKFPENGTRYSLTYDDVLNATK